MFAFKFVALLAALFSVPILGHRTSATGSIDGKVTIRQLPARVANRYATGGTATREVESLPAMAFIEGEIAGASAPAIHDPEMAQQDTSFEPATVIVPVGTSVRFANHDKFFHNVFSYSKTKRFDLGRYPKGESKTVTFDKPGTVAVFCEIHKWMRGAVLVVENPYYTTVQADGTFRIPNVPAGSYKVSVWHPERGKKTFDVVVPQNGVARVDATL